MRSTLRRSLFTVAVIGLAMGLAAVGGTGCSQEKYKPAEKAAGGLTDAASNLTKGQASIGEALTSLNNLTSSSGGDLRAKYDSLTKAMNNLDSSAKDAKSKADDMKAKGDAYFANWDKESAAIKNEDIRARSDARKADVKNQFNTVRSLYQQAADQYRPFSSDLHDIHTALGTDLTPAGLNSVKDVVSRATKEGTALQDTIAKLSEQFRQLGAKMSPAGT
jgi:chromosome segregation ATPase